MPGRRRAAAAPGLRAARRGARVARVARRARVWSARRATRCTTGVRFDPRGLTDALVRAAGEVRFEQPVPDAGTDPGTDAGTDPGTDTEGRSSSRPAGFRAIRGSSTGTSSRRRRCGFGRIRGAPATGCGSRSPAAPRCRAASTSSTAATWPTSTFGDDDFVSPPSSTAARARSFNDDGEEFLDQSRLVVGARPRPGDGAPAGRAGLVPLRRARPSTSRPLRERSASSSRRRPRALTRPTLPFPAAAASSSPPYRVSRRDHAHDRRPADRRSTHASSTTTARRRRPLRRGRRRGRHLDRRLRERPRRRRSSSASSAAETALS